MVTIRRRSYPQWQKEKPVSRTGFLFMEADELGGKKERRWRKGSATRSAFTTAERLSTYSKYNKNGKKKQDANKGQF